MLCGRAAGQAYQQWKAGGADALFIINNDVLVPDGALSALAHALTPEGARSCRFCPSASACVSMHSQAKRIDCDQM